MWVVTKEHWVHCQKKNVALILLEEILYANSIQKHILHILVMKIVLVNLHAIVPDHPYRLFFEHLSFKPMGIVSFWAKYKTCYLKKAVLLAKIRSIQRKQKVVQNL